MPFTGVLLKGPVHPLPRVFLGSGSHLRFLSQLVLLFVPLLHRERQAGQVRSRRDAEGTSSHVVLQLSSPRSSFLDCACHRPDLEHSALSVCRLLLPWALYSYKFAISGNFLKWNHTVHSFASDFFHWLDIFEV